MGIKKKNGVVEEITQDGEVVFDRDEERKKIAKKTIDALESTNGRGSQASQNAKDRLEEIW